MSAKQPGLPRDGARTRDEAERAEARERRRDRERSLRPPSLAEFLRKERVAERDGAEESASSSDTDEEPEKAEDKRSTKTKKSTKSKRPHRSCEQYLEAAAKKEKEARNIRGMIEDDKISGIPVFKTSSDKELMRNKVKTLEKEARRLKEKAKKCDEKKRGSNGQDFVLGSMTMFVPRKLTTKSRTGLEER